jgi:hypothetical protein
MSIKKYTNFEQIDVNTDNKGKFLLADDLFIVSKNEIQETDFGDCKYDVMEVSVYDINSNLLPQKSGNNVAYIKKGEIKHYMHSITNKGGLKELAIDAEKLLNDLGFTNGILKLNINFVRNRVGTDNLLTRVWIQEISPSREEIRILPLKTKDENINSITNREFNNLQNLNKDFKYYKKTLLDSVYAFEGSFLEGIDSTLETQFGKDFFNTLKKDFGLNKFPDFRKKIYVDFQTSVNYYLNNKYYNITESKFGKPSEERFDDCDQYDFNILTNEIKKILFECVDFNIKTLKRRPVEIKTLPKEFAIVELRKQIANNLEAFKTPTTFVRNVYDGDKVQINLNDTFVGEVPIKKEPVAKPQIIEPAVITEPIVVTAPAPIESPAPEVILPTPSQGGGGGGSIYREYDTLDRQNLVDGGMGRERVEFR